jgi:uncharacterized protein (TIGR02271 family)
VHDNQIVALYETNAEARAAQQALTEAGFSATATQVVARDPGGSTDTDQELDEGLWGSIKSLFVPDEERSTYNTAIARGHAMLVVTPDRTMDREHLIRTLESTHPLDLDSKIEEWRQAGHDTTSATIGQPTSNTATAGHATDAGMNATAVDIASPATTPADMASANYASQMPSGATAGTGMAAQSTVAEGSTPETIKVVEERLRVGKREIASGAVRIRSYIVERSIEETVQLHEEHVSVERHPVDRAATAADLSSAFQERMIEARATSEEVVVGKEARVVEEIALHKNAIDRVETVRDTVRKTEVEIENGASETAGSSVHGTRPKT